jgi:hypothetical protein
MKLTRPIKEQLKLLMQAYPYDPRPFGYISHPLVSSSFAPKFDGDKRGEGFTVVTSENWNEILTERIDWMLNLKSVETVFYVALNTPYKIDVLRWVRRYLTRKEYSTILRAIWTEVEFPHQSGVRNLVNMFKNAEQYYLMDAKERKAFEKMQANPGLLLYRGLHDKRSYRRGLSWTTDYEKAKWFALRFSQFKRSNAQVVVTATCPPKHRFAYFAGRNESEVVVNPNALHIISVEKMESKNEQ